MYIFTFINVIKIYTEKEKKRELKLTDNSILNFFLIFRT